MFSEMLEQIKQEVMSTLARVEIRSQEEIDALERQQQMPMDMNFEHAESSMQADETEAPEKAESHQPFVRNDKKIGRNDPCYCGSGKKFKQCHGKLS